MGAVFLVALLFEIAAFFVAKAVYFPAWRSLALEAVTQGATYYVSGGPEIYFYRNVEGRLEHAHAEYWPELRSFGWSPEPTRITWVSCSKPLALPQKSLARFGASAP